MTNDRQLQFRTLRDRLMSINPELPRYEIYELTRRRIVAINAAVVAGLLKENQEATYIVGQRACYAREYTDALDHATDGATPQVTAQEHFRLTEADYLIADFDHVCISYVCRYADYLRRIGQNTRTATNFAAPCAVDATNRG